MVNLSSQSMNREIDVYGDNVVIQNVQKTYNGWGDASETTSTASAKAIVNVLSQEDEFVKEGIFQAGDKVFFFKSNTQNIIRGNRIYHDSKWYEIREIINHFSADTLFIIEARTHKV